MKEAWMMTQDELEELLTFDEWEDLDRVVSKGSKAITFRDGVAMFSRAQTTGYPIQGYVEYDGYDDPLSMV